MVRRPLGNHYVGPDTLLVTSDTTQTEPVAEDTEPDTEKIRELITRARVVLWDFDGPICRLFAGHSAERVATELVEWLEGRGLHGLLTEPERQSLDPHVVLRAVDRRHPGSDLVAELEERLTQEELRAASSAMPTAYADPLIRTWTAIGSRLAIATNNSPRVVRKYLMSRDLVSCFTPHIYGRTQDLHHLKPHPHCLNRALSAMGAAPSASLMIGDAPSDLEAALQAGVPFLGYARNGQKAKLLMEAGADAVVGSLEPLLKSVRG
ncbi:MULTISPECIES: HAD family hydrolase [unclassified Streptomyces]|uniref:HAD family hydrolase n=1 Tax=unclassified Streptomyces TaxID=2593676 RepID=UPI00225231E7|nr:MULTISPECIES: HAD-IA family hydrolase [unclassified Streptomyces]MCX4881798.1 HAD-IA family hydrolase [Streptomyces sp. NBC_00847]MCX5421791.1 HAD-IA family hydrolase [Streptomyces sp. NBC_00078]